MLYGSEEAALVAQKYVNIGSLFTKYGVDKARFTRRYIVYVVIAMETNADIIIHVPAIHASGHLHPCKRYYRITPSYHHLYTSL